MISYYEIGQRVRKYRKACRLSQEELAEKVGISTTHMSHIETGNTKLSLQVLVDLSAALEISTDTLLSDAPSESKEMINGEIAEILESCTAAEIKAIKEIIFSVKVAFNKYF